MARRQIHIENYSRVKIEGASPMGLIYILYDGAIKDLNDAQKHFDSRNREKFSVSIVHAQDCIRELRNALKLQEGPQVEIAASLYRLYSFCVNQLVEANLSRGNPRQNLENVQNILLGLKSAWKEGEKKEQQKGNPLQHLAGGGLSITG